MHSPCFQLCNPSATLWRKPAAIQDAAAFPPLPHPHPPHPDLVPLLHLYVPESRPLTSHRLHTNSLPTGSPGLQPCPPNPSSHYQKSDRLILNLTPCGGPHRPPDKVPAPGPTHRCSGAGPAWAPLSFPAVPKWTTNSGRSRTPSHFMPLNLFLCTCDSHCLKCPF